MTTQLPPRERATDWEHPEVLFEEARQRRRRRWMAGSGLVTAAIIAGALILGMSGGGGARHGNIQGQPPGPGAGAGSGHASASRLFPGVPATQGYYTGPGGSCAPVPRNRYLPPWSGCVSAIVADVSGDGRPDLILTYSRLSHRGLSGLPPRTIGRHRTAARYLALAAMLRVVTPGGRVSTIPITYRTTPINKAPALLVKADAAALISVAHVSEQPGKTIFLQTGQLSSGTLALAYSLYHGHLISSGVVLGYRGDGGTKANFQCLAGSPAKVVQHTYQLIGVINRGDYGWWNETTTTYAWHGPRLARIAQNTRKRRIAPRESVGSGCTKGIA